MNNTLRRRPDSFAACNTARYSKTIAVVVSNTNTFVFNLPTDDTLRKSRIIGVEALSLDDVTVGPQNVAVINSAVFSKSYLTIKSAGTNEEVLAKIPLERMRAYNNSGMPFPVCIEEINPSDCYVEVGSVAGLVANEAFLITFHFERKTV